MKKLICVLLACALCGVALCGCSGGKPDADAQSETGKADYAPAATSIPEEGDHGETDQSAALETLPTLEPVERIDGGDAGAGDDEYYSIDALINEAGATVADQEGDSAAEPLPQSEQEQGAVQAVPTVDTSLYQFSALVDTSLGFTFNYPSHWQNVPGVYTVCFREAAEPGHFPARVAITGKKLVHTPEGTVLTDELSSYMRMVYKQYDPNTFQAGTPNTHDTFMGKEALSNTYLAYSGETEVKGFVLARAEGRVLYVFHFCAGYEDYAAMESLMRYMANSVELVKKD